MRYLVALKLPILALAAAFGLLAGGTAYAATLPAPSAPVSVHHHHHHHHHHGNGHGPHRRPRPGTPPGK